MEVYAAAVPLLPLLQTTPHAALMWRPDIKKYNLFTMTKTDEHVKPFSNDHIGLTFPLPTPISNAFQV
jgi:hypothetical protein